MDCERAREQLEAWAIGALEPAEARALEEHLEACDACRALADEARETANALALAVPMTAASAALKSRVMASAAVLTDIHPRRRARLWPAAAAALAAVAIGGIAWGAFTQARVNDLEDRNAAISADATAQAADLASAREQFEQTSAQQGELAAIIETQDTVIDVVLQPDAQRTELNGTSMAPAAKARCVWSRARSLGALIADGLPRPPQGFLYTVWVVYERDWIDAGAFTVDEDGRGRMVMEDWDSSEDAGAFVGFAVTLDEATGSTRRGDTVLASTGLND